MPAPTSLRLITHNGKMPSRGGQIIGVIVDGILRPIGRTLAETIDLNLDLGKPKPLPTPPPPIKFSWLPWADGYCDRCGIVLSTKLVRISTDQGDKDLLKCTGCGTLHR